MLARHQLAVASPISLSGLAHAACALAMPSTATTTVTETLTTRYGARAVALTDSGTSALTLALRIAVGTGNTVAFPAYVCVDLIAAARFANVRVRLYDIDPKTLSPDLDSVRRVLHDGAAAIVVAHLYGIPADVDGVRALAAQHGTIVIEDAAQHAGATLNGRRTGTLGDISILSFGRGKGTTAGNGGALLAIASEWTDRVNAVAPRQNTAGRGIGDVIGAAATWMLGRPSLYAIPASIPSLHLGETVYHDAHEPTAISHAAATLLTTSLRTADVATARRQRIAAELIHAANRDPAVQVIASVPGGTPGYLRLPLLAPHRAPAPHLGIMRGYPRSLDEQSEIAALLHASDERLSGARILARSLLTVPTHHLVTEHDKQQIIQWFANATANTRDT